MGRITGKEQLSAAVDKAKPVAGCSMFPAILSSAELKTRRAVPEEIRIGDVICYPQDSRTMVAHRVIRIEQNGPLRTFITRGDAQQTTVQIDETAVVEQVECVEYPMFSYAMKGPLGRFFAWYAVSDSFILRQLRRAIAASVPLTQGVIRRLRRYVK